MVNGLVNYPAEIAAAAGSAGHPQPRSSLGQKFKHRQIRLFNFPGFGTPFASHEGRIASLISVTNSPTALHLKRLVTPLAALIALGPAWRRARPSALSRIKDLASVEGVRTNQILGYGIVVGLNGTGDTLNNTPFTKQSLQAMLERSASTPAAPICAPRNVAAVMVTAQPAALLDPRHQARRHRLRPRRRQVAAGRHATGDAAAGCRWRGLCHHAGAGRDLRLLRPRARRPRSPAACRRSAASPMAASSSARSTSR